MSKTYRFFSGYLFGQLAGILLLSLIAVADEPAKILQITPAGEVKSDPPISQIVIQYDKPVVPLGRMEREASEVSVKIEPKVECQWRWLDQSNLACQISTLTPLKGATTYTVKVEQSDLFADKEAFREPFEGSFTLDRPAITSGNFVDYQSPGKPRFTIQAEVPLDRSSVKKHLFFVDNEKNRYEVDVDELAHSPYDYEDYTDTTFQRGTYFYVEPARELPPGKEYILKSEKGIRPRSGNAISSKGKKLGTAAAFGAFSLVGIECYPAPPSKERESEQGEEEESGTPIQFAGTDAAALEKSASGCNPLDPIAIQFTAPVKTSEVRAALGLDPNPYPKEMDDVWQQMPENESLYEAHEIGKTYSVQIPGPLKAERVYNLSLAKDKLHDFFGRTLDSDGQVAFAMGKRKARIVSPPTYSTIESQIDTAPPLYLTNINSLKFNYQALLANGARSQGSYTIDPYTVKNLSYRFPLPAAEILKGGSGLLVGTLDSPEYKPKSKEDFFVQRTPYSVHVKMSLFDTLVWVTDFQTGEVVSDATVEVLSAQIFDLFRNGQTLAGARTDSSGLALLPGLEKLDPHLSQFFEWNRRQPRLIVRVTRGDNVAVVPVEYDFKVDTAYYPMMQKRPDTLTAWGTTAQGIYRAGDTIQFKIFLRDSARDKFVLPPKADYSLEVQDALGKRVFQQSNLKFSSAGTWSGTLPLPESASVGWYVFTLKSSRSARSWEPMRVLVSDFTPAPFRVSVDPDKSEMHRGGKLGILTKAAFHAGGAYGDAKGRLTVTAQSSRPVFSRPALKDFDFADQGGAEQRELLRQEFVLTKAGENQGEFAVNDSSIAFAILSIEGTVSDERGKSISGFSYRPYWGRDRYAGLHVNSWVFEKGKDATVELAVVDPKGELVKDAALSVRIERDQVNVVQTKGAGNAFLPSYQVEQVTVREEQLFSTGEIQTIHFVPQDIGAHRIIVTVTDTAGNQHTARVERWVVGSGDMVWQNEADDQVKVTPDKSSYAVGEVAQFLVQNPFPGARALITVEREGILSQRIEQLMDATSIVKVPVESRFAPGFYLSVVLVSPRVVAPLEKGVDLGKPAFRVGYARANVPRSQERVQIAVEAERKLYQPGDDVILKISTRDYAGKPQRGELAITVLDQAVFDLISDGNSLYDIYSAFYQLGSLGVSNFNILRQLIGRQSFERKGAAEAGDGGRGAEFRSIDSFVAYWNPAISLDASGQATVRFKAPGNLTGWKVFAVAIDNGSRMGTGTSEFAVSKNLEIRPVNPQIARQGDTLQVRFSVMNRSAADLATDIAVTAKGGATGERIVSGRVIKPGQREFIQLELKPNDLKPIELEVRASSGADRDGFKTTIPVLPISSVEHVMQTIALDNPEERIKLKVPGDIKPGQGKMQVSLYPTIVGDMSAPFTYMKKYPYSCWEQRMSKAIMAAWFTKGGNNLPAEFTWDDAGGYVSDLFARAPDFQGESGGMAYFKPDPDSIDPYLSVYTGMIFEWLKGLGYQPPVTVSDKLYGYLQELLKRDPPNLRFYDKSSLLRVRVMALRVLAGVQKAEVEQVKRLLPDTENLDIFSRAQLLDTCVMLGMKDEIVRQRQLIQSQSDMTADAIVFNDSYNEYGYRLLSSAVKGSCMVLDSVLRSGKAMPVSQDWLQKVVRGIVKQKTSNDHWESTQGNVFCINALRNYAAQEGTFTTPLEISAAVESGVFGRARFTSPVDLAKFFQRDILPTEIGIERELIMRKSGERRGYATVGLEFPVTRSGKEVNSGIEVYREFSVADGKDWRVVGDTMSLKLGDVVRVDLYVNVPGARTFVVLEDRLASTFEVLNKQLATTSLSAGNDSASIIPKGSRFIDDGDFRGFGYSFWGFAHREQRKDSVRFYAEYLEPGKYHLTHLVQVVAPGTFTAPAAHSEEMYVPAIYGESSPATVSVPLEK